ncbi:MAG: cell division protein SepF [Lactobacillales bacterium]|nr:cell division protein SepF [Lactobacillales bacterium]
MGIFDKIQGVFGMDEDDYSYETNQTFPQAPITTSTPEASAPAPSNVIPLPASTPTPAATSPFASNVQRPAATAAPKKSIVTGRPGDSKIMIFEPRVVSEGKEIGRHLRQGESSVVNFRYMDEVAALRVVDYLAGVIDTIEGNLQRIGNEIFLCTPTNVVVDGETAASAVREPKFDF